MPSAHLSTFSTVDFPELELAGSHEKLCERYLPLIEALTAREKASVLRSLVFAGRRAEFEALRPVHVNAIERHAEARLVLRLGDAALLRQQGRHDEALETCEALTELACSSAISEHLVNDLRFARAVSLVELNRMFLGLDEFQQLGRAEGVSPFRRGLCKLNEAWILWDMGRTEAMKVVLSEVPVGFRRRFEISMACLDGDTKRLALLFAAFPYVDLPPTEQRNCALLLAEALAVYGDELARAGATPSDTARVGAFCRAEALVQSGRRTFDSATWSLAALLFSPSDDLVLPATEIGLEGTWRSLLRFRFFSFLRLLRTRGDDLRAYFDRSVAPILEERHLRTPLIPAQLEELVEGNAWHNTILRAVATIDAHAEVGRAKWKFRLKLADQCLEIVEEERVWTVSFAASPSSLRLLEILAWSRDSRVPKRYLHEQLTPSRYVASMHDPRLHKLLQRLLKRIEEADASIPRLFEFRRDNHLHMNFSVEVAERS